MKRLPYALLAAVCLSLLGSVNHAAAPAPAVPTAWPLPKGVGVGQILLSPHGTHFAYLRPEADGTSTVVRDGVDVATHVHPATREDFRAGCLPVTLPTLYFSPDDATLTYVAAVGHGMRVVVGGTAEPVYDEVGNLVFSGNGRHRAYAARVGKAWHVVRDGEDQPGAYAAIGGGRGMGGDPTLFDPVLSPDGAHLLYAAWGAGPADAGMVLVVDGKAFGPYTALNGLSATPDLSRYAVRVHDGTGARILDTGTLLPAADSVSAPVVSADGKHLAYMRQVQDTYHLLLDGDAKPTWDRKLRPVIFSPDGTRYAFVGTSKEGQDALVVDGITVGFAGMVNDGIYGVYFSPDSRHVAYRTRDRLAVIGEPKLGGRISERADPFLFSPDSRHLAYLAETPTGPVLMRDARAVGPVAGTVYGLTFSPDSAHLVAVVGVPGTPRMQLLIDGVAGPRYDTMLTFPYDHGPNFFFTAPDRFFFYAIRGHTLLREVGTIPLPAK